MSTQPTINNLILDLTGVIFLIDQRKALQMLGLKNVLLYTLTHFKNPFNQVMLLTDTIARREKNNTLPLLFYKGYQQPSCIAASHLGLITLEQAQMQFAAQVRELIDEGFLKNKLEINIMKRFADLLVDTKTKTAIMKPNYALINILKDIQKRGTATCYILSNLDIGTYDYLRTNYPEIFALFKDSVISAEVGMMKPNKDIYEYTLETHNLAPHTCLFIDDQPENIESAQEIGIPSILYTNTRALNQKLTIMNLL